MRPGPPGRRGDGGKGGKIGKRTEGIRGYGNGLRYRERRKGERGKENCLVLGWSLATPLSVREFITG